MDGVAAIGWGRPTPAPTTYIRTILLSRCSLRSLLNAVDDRRRRRRAYQWAASIVMVNPDGEGDMIRFDDVHAIR